MPIGEATYNLGTAQVRTRVRDFAQRMWADLGSWRDDDIEKFVRAVVPVVAGGQRQIASLTDAYLAEQVSELYGTSRSATGVGRDDLAGTRNGVPLEEVYRRPAVDTYTALKQGSSLQQAVRVGGNRIGQLVDLDIQLAKTHAARRSLRDSPARYFRRTLTGNENCALCIVASTQRYRTDELMPIHAHCDCGIAPLRGNAPHVIDPEALEEVHEAYERMTGGPADRSGRGAIDYRRILVTRDHGEYGPVLTFRGQKFTGPSDLR